MTKASGAVAKAEFSINPEVGMPGPRLPTLGVSPISPMSHMFQVDGVDSYLAALHQSIGDTQKAITDSITEAAKALGATPPQAMTYAKMNFLPDPANYGLMSWPGIQPESLRKIARENIVPQMVMRSRVTDLRRYSSLSTHPWSPGWKIVLREADATPSKQDKEDIKEAEYFIANCSRESVYTNPRDRDAHAILPFEGFLCGMADDTFTFDGWSIWTDRDRVGRVRSFANLPAGLIRLALPMRGYRDDPDLFAALIDETNTPVKAFTRDEMTWRIRNVRNDPAVLGYGWSESEIAILLVQAFQGGIQLNTETFSRNSIPNGMMVLKGDYWQQEQIDALMREWTNMKRGLSKMWGLPVIAVPEDGEIEIMPFMDLKGQEIRYKDHLNLMAGVYCAISQFPIARLGMFASGGSRDNKPVADSAVEIQGVDDPGLPALLTFIENTINEYLLQPNWPKLKIVFMNKNPKEDARSYEAKKLARTWAEARALVDLPPLMKIAPSWSKPMMEIMEACPEDPSKAGVFQALAITMLEDKLGINDQPEGEGGPSGSGDGGKTATPGAPFPSKKDPAKSQAHGHRAGVRRSSRKEAGTGND
jgi:hypothetical protein